MTSQKKYDGGNVPFILVVSKINWMENKLCKKCSNSTLKIFKNVPEWHKENCKQMERLPIFLEKKSQCHHLTYSWCYFTYLILWHLKTSSGFHLKSLVCTINYFIIHFRREIALLRPMLEGHLTHYEPRNKRGSCVSSNISQCKAYVLLFLFSTLGESLCWNGQSKDWSNVYYWMTLLNRVILGVIWTWQNMWK